MFSRFVLRALQLVSALSLGLENAQTGTEVFKVFFPPFLGKRRREDIRGEGATPPLIRKQRHMFCCWHLLPLALFRYCLYIQYLLHIERCISDPNFLKYKETTNNRETKHYKRTKSTPDRKAKTHCQKTILFQGG